MSFRQYGGINYAARNNIVKSNYTNANNLSVMTKVGQPSSIINFESDISGNTIYGPYNFQGDVNITGNLGVMGTTTLGSTLTVNGADALIHGLTVGRGAGSILSNTTLGYQALYSNTTGYQNTALGYYALKANVLSWSNTAIGYNALANNTGPWIDSNNNTNYNTDNTAVGHNALFNNTTGYWNTGIGLNALYSNTTGSFNTAIGLDAGNQYTGPTNCDHCTFIGGNTNTGDINTNVSYSYSTAIGYNARINASNQIMLGGYSGSIYPTVYVPGTLTVTGATTLNSTLTVSSGGLTVSNSGATSLTGSLAVTGATTLSSTLAVTGTINGNNGPYFYFKQINDSNSSVSGTVTLTENGNIPPVSINYAVFSTVYWGYRRASGVDTGTVYNESDTSSALNTIVIYNRTTSNFNWVIRKSDGNRTDVYIVFMVFFNNVNLSGYPDIYYG